MTCASPSGAAVAGTTTPSSAALRGPRRGATRGGRCCGPRAIENQCFVAAANRVGCDPAAHYAGDSALVDFRGRTLAEAGAEACTLTGAFDPAAAGEFREAFPAGRDADEFVLG